MKKLLLFLIVPALIVACDKGNSNGEVQEQGEVTAKFASYGEEISPDAAKEVSDLVALLGEQDSVMVKLAGEIEETCPMKGCWMTVKNEQGESLRVTFKDYGFFVPKEGQEGKKAVFEGVVKKEVLSVEEQQHYAEDAGKSAEEIAQITEPKSVYSIVASGVLIEQEEALN